ncbi:unnamed protein product [Diplocarpon coronariae]|uniref:Autophagy-related protein 16 domain-containing protein n=1 Tax=Diplocarpon coronariae TaxID=2795749 RepID=A0A218YUM4_9HELO|nr:hypothetical protein B2J93_1163 [Marssonina coronariae]
MTSWRDEYIQNLRERDQREKASYHRLDSDLISAFTNLLDKVAVLEASQAANNSTTDTKPRDSSAPPEPTGTDDCTLQIRRDLTEALRSNGQLQSRIKSADAELAKLKIKSRAESRQVDELSRDRAFLSQKLKDRDEELKGKTKLLDDVHDEFISLNLQLNMSEQRVKDLTAENKELIDRWMARKGREAEEMNKAFT